MIFTGKNLRIIRCALAAAISGLEAEIEEETQLAEGVEDSYISTLEQDKVLYEQLLVRVDAGLAKEAAAN